MPTSTAPARVAAAALGGVLLAGCHSTPPNPTLTPAANPPAPQPDSPTPGTVDTTPQPTARQRLHTLADSISTLRTDQPNDLPYTYLHTQTWARATTTITRTDLRRWRHHTNGSGHDITRRTPDLPHLHHQPTPAEHTQLTQARPTTTRHPAGTLRPYLPEPLPTDPNTLTALLAPPELAGEAAYPRLVATGIAALATNQYLHHQDRATTLRVLATIPGITYRGDSTDPAGRTGHTFQVTADDSTTTLLINPTTGELLAAHEHLTGPRPGLFSYVLILHREHTATVTPATPDQTRVR
ncbi:hypothetical protein QQG74_21430 [Micromonospora sp. FIMYZ51]|uniref:hypothetical protein n=1 Tax=Micromonospora sp. FIMYZ51 TaxID=3051832 RepID=UPI00311FFEFF